MKNYDKGDRVKWEWGEGHGTGVIKKKYTSEVEQTIKGTTVKRNASAADPAYLIEQEDGDEVLKSGSELKQAQK